MFGAICGDIVGAPYEFHPIKSKHFPLIVRGSHYTDDTVMTVAVAEGLLNSFGKSDEDIKKALIISMKKWGRLYPNASYGVRFFDWLFTDTTSPYGSYGNGSAMRVSSVGWLYNSLDETRHVARLTAEVTHNHPEGIKGAESTASAIFLARTGCTKAEIRKYIADEFNYDLSRTADEISPTYYHVESCQESVPEAFTAFLEGESFEDVLRTTVYIGGDCDTTGAIAGAVAEAFYGIPDNIKRKCEALIPQDMLMVVRRFEAFVSQGGIQ